jgi:hypothetical protein
LCGTASRDAEHAWQIRGDHLEHVLRAGEVPQPMPTQVPQFDSLERHVMKHLPRGAGHENLSAVGRRQQAGSMAEGETRTVLAGLIRARLEIGGARVHRHADANGAGLAPGFGD